MYKAVGIHVFAGAFTVGVQQHFDVQCQLEAHGFGQASCESMCKIPFVNDDNAQWPEVEAQFAYGNPRCTGFSCITAGYGEDCHGPWSKQTEDIHQMCKYAAGKYDIIIWESVQQAYSTGRPLLDYLRDEIFVPKNYRIAHILLNAASFGNAQQRRRYFFVAYRDDRNFNIVPPDITGHMPLVADSIYDLKDRPANEVCFNKHESDYDADSYMKLTPNEKIIVPKLPTGWGLNGYARYATDELPPGMRQVWDYRESEMPFSMHCIYRMGWLNASPTIHSSATRFIHPEHDRPLTIGEIARIMGWPDIPRGPMPVAQIAKGVCPEVGTWLADQARMYLDNAWGNEDWESSYDDSRGTWCGGDAHGAVEKEFNLNRYVGKYFDPERYRDHEISIRRFNVDQLTGEPVRPWKTIRESFWRNNGASGLDGHVGPNHWDFSAEQSPRPRPGLRVS